MVGHGVDVASRSNITMAPRPNQFHKHFDVTEPLASNYAELYTVLPYVSE